jgi:hypothetical protein
MGEPVNRQRYRPRMACYPLWNGFCSCAESLRSDARKLYKLSQPTTVEDAMRITRHLEQAYGTPLSAETVSRITDQVLEEMRTWQ